MLKKIIKSILIGSLLINFSSVDLFVSLSEAQEVLAPEMDLSHFSLPAYLGKVDETWISPTASKIIFHIQDAHCNYFAQKKIAQIISYLNSEYEISTVNLEGGSGLYDHSLFYNIFGVNIREKVSDYFVKQGILSGAEYYAVNNQWRVNLWGMEDVDLYKKNLNVFRRAINSNEKELILYRNIISIVESLEKKVYSKEALELKRLHSGYVSGDIRIGEYLQFLTDVDKAGCLGAEKYGAIKKMKKAIDLQQKIDFRKAEDEREMLINETQLLLSKKGLRVLYKKTAEFTAGKISESDFYGFLLRKAKLVNIELEKYRDLTLYKSYLDMYSLIDQVKLIEEINASYEEIFLEVLTDDKEKKLFSFSQNMRLMGKLFDFLLLKDEYQNIAAEGGGDFSSENIHFVEELCDEYGLDSEDLTHIGELKKTRDNIIKFFKYSFKRDEAFMNNTFGKNGAGYFENRMIMVTGGFHSPNLKKLLKDKNISYVSILPYFEEDAGYVNPYFKLLEGDQTIVPDKVEPNNLALYSDFCSNAEYIYGNDHVKGTELWVKLITGLFSGKNRVKVGNRTYALQPLRGSEKVSGMIVEGKQVYARNSKEGLSPKHKVVSKIKSLVNRTLSLRKTPFFGLPWKTIKILFRTGYPSGFRTNQKDIKFWRPFVERCMPAFDKLLRTSEDLAEFIDIIKEFDDKIVFKYYGRTFVGDTVPGFSHLISNMDDLYNVLDNIYDSFKNSKSKYRQAILVSSISALGHVIEDPDKDIKKLWDMLEKISLDTKKAALTTFFEYGIRELATIVNSLEELDEKLNDIFSLEDQISNEELSLFYSKGLGEIMWSFGGSSERYWEEIITMAKDSREGAGVLFAWGLHYIRELYPDEKEFVKEWPVWHERIYRFIRATNDYNRKKIFNELFRTSYFLEVLAKKTDSKLFDRHMDLYESIIKKYPDLAAVTIRKIFKAMQANILSVEISPKEEENIIKLLERSNAFDPVAYELLTNEGESGIEAFNVMSKKMAAGDFDPNDLKAIKEKYEQKGYDGKTMTMAALNNAMPLKDFSFWDKKNLQKDFDRIVKSRDGRKDIPEEFKGKERSGKEKAIVHEAGIGKVKYSLKKGQKTDPDKLIRDMVMSLTLPESGAIESKKKLVSSIKRYLNSRTEEFKKDVVENFYQYMSNKEEEVEAINMIQILDYKSLKTMEEAFLDENAFPESLRKVLNEDIPKSMFREKGTRKITKSEKLTKSLQAIFAKEELSAEKRMTILRNKLKVYDSEEIKSKILRSLGDSDPLAEVLRSILDGGLDMEIYIERVIKEIFSSPLGIIRGELDKYEPVEIKDSTILEFKVVKGAPYRLWAKSVGVCIGADKKLWNDDNFYLLAIIDKEKQKAVGFIHLYETVIDGKKVLTVPGINPSVKFLSQVKVRKLMPEIIKAIQRTARIGMYEKIYLPTMDNKGSILSNRHDVVEFIEDQGYKKVMLKKPVYWNRKPEPYPFDKVYELPLEGEPFSGGAISGGKTTEKYDIIEDIKKNRRPLTYEEQQIVKSRLRTLYNKIHKTQKIDQLIRASIKRCINNLVKIINSKNIVAYSPDIGIRSDKQYVLGCVFDDNGNKKIALVDGFFVDAELSTAAFQQEILLHEILAMVYPEISHLDHKARYLEDVSQEPEASNFTKALVGIQRQVFGYENDLGRALAGYIKRESKKSVIRKYKSSIGKISKTPWEELSEKQQEHYSRLGVSSRILPTKSEESGFTTPDEIDIESLLFQLDMISMKMMGEFDVSGKETDLAALNEEKNEILIVLGEAIGKDKYLLKIAMENIKKYFVSVRKQTQETFNNKKREIASQFVAQKYRILREEEAVRGMAVSEQTKLAEDRALKVKNKKEKELLEQVNVQYGQLDRYKKKREEIIDGAQQNAIKQGAADIVEEGFKRQRIVLREKVEDSYQDIEDNKEKSIKEITEEYERNKKDPLFYLKVLRQEAKNLIAAREYDSGIAKENMNKRLRQLQGLETEILRSISRIFYGRKGNDREIDNIMFARKNIIRDLADKVNGRSNVVKVLIGVPLGIENNREFKKLKDELGHLLEDLFGNNEKKQVYFYTIGSNRQETQKDYRSKLNRVKRIVEELPEKDLGAAQIVSFEYRNENEDVLLPEKEYQYQGMKQTKQVIVLSDSYSDLFYPDILSRVVLAKFIGFYANCPPDNNAGKEQTIISINRLLLQVLEGFKPIKDIKYLFEQVLQFKALPLKDIEHWRIFNKAVGISA